MREPLTDVPLAPMTTLRLGGPADRLMTAGSSDELVELVRAADAEGEPLLILAGGSNVVIADEGFRGTVVEVASRGFEERVDDEGLVELSVQAGEPWDRLVEYASWNELAGIECLSGIPGSTGATPIQNVGAYGQEVSSTISSVTALDRAAGEVVRIAASQCGFAYRSSRFKGSSDFVVLEVSFRLSPSRESEPVVYGQLAEALDVDTGSRAPLGAVRETVLELRRAKSMVVDPADPDSVSAGSFFTNPVLDREQLGEIERRAAELLGPDVSPPVWPTEDGRFKTSAAWLIERSGFSRGYGEGRVGLSRNHTLAIVNRGAATTSELVAFAREIADGVRITFGVALVPEPVFVGHSW